MSNVFRIERAGTLKAQGAEDPATAAAAYMGRLVALIPAEVLAVYQTLYGVLAEPPSALLGWLPLIGVLLVVLVRSWGTRDSSGSWATVQWLAVLVAAVSFIIWVLVSNHPILGFKLPDLRIGSVLMVLWVFLIPFFYKGS